MTEHALDLLHAALWVIGIVGGLLVTIVGWGGKIVFDRLDTRLTNIEKLLANEVKAITEKLGDHAVRIGKIETKCEFAFGNSGQHPLRRASDKSPDDE